jgi:flagellar hook-length control protein FliK
MLKINTVNLRGSQNDIVMPTLSASEPADPAGFASLLRQTQVATSAPAANLPRTDVPARHDTAVAPDAPKSSDTSQSESASANEGESTEASANAGNEASARARAQLKPKPRNVSGDGNTAASGAKAANAADGEKTATAADAKAADGSAPTTGVTAVDPAVAQWLASLQRPAATPATEQRSAGKTDDATAALGQEAGGARALKTADLKAQDEVNDKAARGDDRFKAEFNPIGSSAVMAEQRIVETTTKPSGVAGVNELAAAGGTAHTAPQTSVREAEAPTVVAVPTPVDAPDFAQALGLQMSVLTRDGVQQAELHLNPADMGPVSVQIVMDGTQARIDFGADVAATRQAIEAGLPELASALRDAGFTLAGGGVSQHSSGRGDAGGAGTRDGGSESRGNARRVTDDTVARVGSAARRVVTAGGLDLYA